VVALLAAWPLVASAATVTPADRVQQHIIVREEPTRESAEVGKLRKNEQAELLEAPPFWYKVRLPSGEIGYVSKAWSRLIDAAPTPAAPAVPATSVTAFNIHFLDVGTGDSAIIDIGDREVVIDGGDSVRVLHDYCARTGVIQDPIELAVVTHGDSDHWKGLNRLLGFDGQASHVHRLKEFWEPGYSRDCSQLDSYDEFIADVRGSVPAGGFHRPLETSHAPAAKTHRLEPFSLADVPGLTITVLHTEANPTATDCAYRINDASIVLLIEVSGVRFLFTGDANGKERDEPGPGTPGHVEQQLLALNAANPGALKADVLKVPHHGSETASTQAFIDAVDPKFVIISASTKHHLPKDTVVHRYENAQRVILQTDAHRENDQDHIVCSGSGPGQVDCNFRDVLDDGG